METKNIINNDIKEIVNKKAFELYGNVLPQDIEERLNAELRSIIENEFDLIYMITKKLVEKSQEHSHFIGNRGCIGSSLVAYLLGITECNPLPKKYGGYNIPFEVLAGIDLDKTLDISLNVSADIYKDMCQYLDEILKLEGILIDTGDIKESNGIYTFKRRIKTRTGKYIGNIDLLSHEMISHVSRLYNLTNTKAKVTLLDNINIHDFVLNNKLYQTTSEEISINTFDDLVRIYSLIHGTGTWKNNAEDLINNGEAELSQVITSRDDVMIYLMEKGIDRVIAYNIMENVRKGKGLTLEMESTMSKHDIPKWYIKSCNKIQYLFPKAHGIDYTILLLKLAWYEKNYNKEFKNLEASINRSLYKE